MPILIGPTYEENEWSRHPFWGRYKMTKGITLVVKDGVVTELTYPWAGDLYPGGDTNPDWDYIYPGGQTITISSAEAAILTAAGYGAYIH